MAHGYMSIRFEHSTNCDGVFGEFNGTRLMDQTSYTDVDNCIRHVQKIIKKYTHVYITFSKEEIGKPEQMYGRIAKWSDSNTDWMYWDKYGTIIRHDETETATPMHIKSFILDMIDAMKEWEEENNAE